MSVLQAIFEVGQYEVTSIITVADMTLYVGLGKPSPIGSLLNSARIVSTMEGVDACHVVDCNKAEALLAVKCFMFGESAVTEVEYKQLEALQPKATDSVSLPEGDSYTLLRFIP